ncbi:MAG: hypothetical protein GY930_19735 [bacterium]|nr:hypothetical protein [bacterium]
MDKSRYKEVEAIFVDVVDLPLDQRKGRIQEFTSTLRTTWPKLPLKAFMDTQTAW